MTRRDYGGSTAPARRKGLECGHSRVRVRVRHRIRGLATTVALTWAFAGGATAIAAQQYNVQLEAGAVEVPRGTVVIQALDSVWTGSGGVLEGVSIVIRDGVIREIGTDVAVPRGARVIDGAGLTAIPGLVDEHSHIAMTTSNECTSPIVPETRVADQLRPDDFAIYQALAGGVTAAQVLHGSCNPVGGQSAIIKTRWGLDEGRKLLIQGAPQTVKFALGENVTRKSWGSDGIRRYPWSRQGVESIYIQAFTAAQAYRDAWAAYRDNPRAYRVPPRRDHRLEALVDIMEGRIRVHAHSYRADEILMLMRVAERFGFTIDAFTHALEAYKIADELAEHGAAASIFSDWWQYKLEAFDAIPYAASILHDHGVSTSLNSDIPWLQQVMVYEIAKPVKYGGTSREDALRMLTLYPAEQLHIDDKVGSLDVGKHGDVVLLSGDPFDAFSRVETTLVDGIVYYDRQRDAETRGEPVNPMEVVEAAPPVAARVPWAEARSLPRPQGPMNGDGRGSQTTAVRTVHGAGSFALVGATVHPVDGPAVTDGVVVVEDGRITGVGRAAEVQIPSGARRVDVGGKHVYPGMIDPLTSLGLFEIGQVPSASDEREVGRFNPHTRAMVGLQAHSIAIPVNRANGITAVLAAQTSGIITGAGSLIQLVGDTPERMSVLDRAALVINFPEAPGEAWDEPKLEGEDLEDLVALFRRAVAFARTPSVQDDPTAPFEAQVDGGDRLLLESLVPAVTGAMPVLLDGVHSERQIRTALLFLDEFPDVRAALVGAEQAFRLADELAERTVPVLVGSSLLPTYDRNDPIDANWRLAAALHSAGVPIAFTSKPYADYQGSPDIRNLPYMAARSVAYGLPYDVALRALTLGPAEVLGLGAEMGSITVGKRADLIVTDGDPLQIPTRVEQMFINGIEVDPDANRHYELYRQFLDRH